MTSSLEGRQEAAVLDAKALELAHEIAEAAYMAEENEGLAFDVAVTEGIRAYLTAIPAPVAAFVPCDGCDGYECIGRCSYPVAVAKAAPVAAVPVAYASAGQLNGLADRPGDGGGVYIPLRKTPLGQFQMPLFSALIPAKPAVEVVEALRQCEQQLVALYYSISPHAEYVTPEGKSGNRFADKDVAVISARCALAALQAPATPDAHPDDLAVDRFAAAMKAKLAKKREQGRGGWDDSSVCSNDFLSRLLREHVEMGDPLDVGNIAMMLQQRGERITATPDAQTEVEK